MNEQEIIACICEGAAERAIIEVLLDEQKLIFEQQHLLDEKVIRIRSAAKFEEQYLRKQFARTIKIYRILDSRRERFKLSEFYENKVEVINIITAPEIEMLIIHCENQYDDYKKSKKKPSEYCKQNLKYPHVKSYQFVREYFSNADTLIDAIKQYHQKANIKQNEQTLFDLLAKK